MAYTKHGFHTGPDPVPVVVGGRGCVGGGGGRGEGGLQHSPKHPAVIFFAALGWKSLLRSNFTRLKFSLNTPLGVYDEVGYEEDMDDENISNILSKIVNLIVLLFRNVIVFNNFY